MAIIFLRKVIKVIEGYKKLNKDEQAEMRKIMGMVAPGSDEWRPCCFTEFRNQWCFQCPWCKECNEATQRLPGQPGSQEASR